MKDLKIAIIGAGWYGCHFALSFLKKGFKVNLYEKNEEIFSEASFNNQNRLHLGFHYPRSYKTRNQSKRGSRLFYLYYPNLIKNIDLSLYAIAEDSSIVDLDTYKAIMRSSELLFEDVSSSIPLMLRNIEGVLDTNEKVIDCMAAKKFFKNELQDIIIKNSELKQKDIYKLRDEGFQVIDCTWNKLFKNDSFVYESTIMFKCKNKHEINFGLTIMDGLFPSVYPVDDKFSTLSDVEFTPFFKTNKYEEAYEAIENINESRIMEIKENMVKKISFYFPQFKEYYEIIEPIFSIKTKKSNNRTDDRSSYLINVDENIYSVFSGKIDTIFDIEFELMSNFLR